MIFFWTLFSLPASHCASDHSSLVLKRCFAVRYNSGMCGCRLYCTHRCSQTMQVSQERPAAAHQLLPAPSSAPAVEAHASSPAGRHEAVPLANSPPVAPGTRGCAPQLEGTWHVWRPAGNVQPWKCQDKCAVGSQSALFPMLGSWKHPQMKH